MDIINILCGLIMTVIVAFVFAYGITEIVDTIRQILDKNQVWE